VVSTAGVDACEYRIVSHSSHTPHQHHSKPGPGLSVFLRTKPYSVNPSSYLGCSDRYKVLLIRRLLEEALAGGQGVEWIMWIDADAVVIDPSIRVIETLIAPREAARRALTAGTATSPTPLLKALSSLELVIGEDITPTMPVNMGVALVRVSEWSRRLWDDVWMRSRYFARPYYEQAALVKCLEKRWQGLSEWPRSIPFHSYLPGYPGGDKHFPNVCVLPHLDINSTLCGAGMATHPRMQLYRQFRREQLAEARRRGEGGSSPDHPPGEGEGEGEEPREEEEARFIFHAAGKSKKLTSITAMMDRHGIQVRGHLVVRGRMISLAHEAISRQQHRWVWSG
jgi:hypothetical protein